METRQIAAIIIYLPLLIFCCCSLYILLGGSEAARQRGIKKYLDTLGGNKAKTKTK